LRCPDRVAKGPRNRASARTSIYRVHLLEQLVDNCRLLELSPRGDERGSLIPLETGRDVPFDIKRVYYLFGTVPDAQRGFHAHRDLEQLAVCVAGACTMVLDDGRSRREVRLDRPDKGLFLGPFVWREMRDFTADAVLLVLASKPYDEADYIRSYPDFLAAIEEAQR